MDEQTPGPAGPPPDPDPDGADRGTSRRGLLAGALAVAAVVGGGAGVTARLLRPRRRRRPAPDRVPTALRAAVTAERRLIADLDATTGGTAPVRTAIRTARADHVAHLAALQELVTAAGPEAAAPPSGSATATRTSAPGTARTRAQLASAELRASVAGARRAGELSGPTAALLASIAACEAAHAELLR